jgi:uncharacterized protein YjeT (DUF2065 family)
MFTTLVTAFAIFLIIEGLLPALFPNQWRAYLAKLLQQPVESVRTMGTVTVLMGAIILWLVK